MCGRGGLHYDWSELWAWFNLSGEPPAGGIRILNLAPSQRRGEQVAWSRVPVIRQNGAGPSPVGMVWPLIPAWSKGQLPKFSTANCRSEADTPFSETVSAKPTFRNAWKRDQRCVVPFSWFYEWDQRSRPKQPWRVFPTRDPALYFAGLWERSVSPDDEVIESFTIITTGANRLLDDIGHHRCPVMLTNDDFETWLSGDKASAEQLIRPPTADGLAAHRVTTRVNNPGYQEADLLEETTSD